MLQYGMKALLWAAWFTLCSTSLCLCYFSCYRTVWRLYCGQPGSLDVLHHYVIVTLLQYGMKALLWAAWFTWCSTSLCLCYFVTVRYEGFTVGSLVHLMFYIIMSLLLCYSTVWRLYCGQPGSLDGLHHYIIVTLLQYGMKALLWAAWFTWCSTSLCHCYFVTVRYEGFTVGSLVHLMGYIIISLLLCYNTVWRLYCGQPGSLDVLHHYVIVTLLQYGMKALLWAAWFTWCSTSLCHCYFLCYSTVWRLYCGQPGSLYVLHHYVIVTLLQYGMKALLWVAWFTWCSTSLCLCYFSCYSTVWRLYCGQPGSLDVLHHYVIVTSLQYGMKALLWAAWFTWFSTSLCLCYFVTVRYEGFTVGSLVHLMFYIIMSLLLCYSTVWRLYCGQPGSLDGLHHYIIVTLLQYGMKALLWAAWFTWWSTSLYHCYFVTVRYEGFTVGSLVRSQGRR